MKSGVQFLLQNKQYEKAVEAMVSIGNNDEALATAEKHGVNLKEDTVKKLIDVKDPQQKKTICLKLAKLVKRQGDFV